MNFKLLIEKAKQEGIKDVLVYYLKTVNKTVKLHDSKIESNTISNSSNLTVSGVYNDKLGTTMTEVIDDSSIDSILKNIKMIASNITVSDIPDMYKGEKNYQDVKTFNNSLKEVTFEERINTLKNVDKSIRENKTIDTVSYAMYVEREVSYKVYGEDTMLHGNSINAYYVMGLVTSDENKKYTHYELEMLSDINKFDENKFVNKCVKKAIAKIGTIKPDSMKCPAILSKGVSASLLDKMSPMFNMDQIEKGMSKLGGKINEKIASDILTISDNPLADYHMASREFDDECVPTYNKLLVENGVLKTFLHNLKTAKKSNQQPTGNGFKGGIISAVNLKIENGENSFDDLLKEVKNGIIIEGLQGLNAGLNPITGDFSLQAEGFLIEDSKITKPVDLFTISGNYFELLKSVTMVANDLKIDLSNTLSPSVAIKEITISGK